MPFYQLVGWSASLFVGPSVIIQHKGGKLNFHASFYTTLEYLLEYIFIKAYNIYDLELNAE